MPCSLLLLSLREFLKTFNYVGAKGSCMLKNCGFAEVSE